MLAHSIRDEVCGAAAKMKTRLDRGRRCVLATAVLLVSATLGHTARAQAAAGAAAGDSAARMIEHRITNGVSVQLPVAWSEFKPGDAPAALAPYSPPFHMGGILALQNLQANAIVEFATSDNPLLGHDANWLDGQLHMPSGSGMSMIDFLFYYLFPPSAACINEAMANNARASFAPAPNNSSSDAPPVLQVSYACRHDVTLEGFFGAQVSSGITFVQTNQGPRAYGMTAQFYLAPMERVTSPGMTWYMFSAQRVNPVNPGTSAHFNLPTNLQGAQAEFYWAIGAVSPFPWVYDGGRANQQLIHMAYAGVGLGGNKRAEFVALLQRVQARGASAGGGQ
jgi:hypothetical protein